MEYIAIEESCRACQINTQEESEKIFIFTTAKLPDIFKETTSLDIQECDGLPKVLCSTCYDRLLEAYNFRKMCSAAVVHFQKILSIDVPEEKYTPPENVSNVPMTDAILMNIKTEPDSDPMNFSVKYPNYSPDRENSQTEISDMLCIDENLPEILKTDPNDEVIKQEDVPSETLNDISMAKERKVSITGAEDSIEDASLKSGIVKKTHNTRKRPIASQKNKKHILPGGSTKFECTMCNLSFHRKSEVRMHIRKDHLGLEVCKCNICGKEFTSSYTLTCHLNTHEIAKGPEDQKDVNQYLCAFCGVEQETSDEFKSHMETHKKNNRWFCVFCPYNSIKKCHLQDHVKVVHQKVKEFHCPRCDRSFTGAGSLEQHILRHEGIKNHTCTVCGVKKVTRTELAHHMIIHIQDKIWSCDSCPLKFKRRDNLKDHIKTVHQRVKDYQCTLCKKCFSAAKSLKYHLMIHSGERPHGCSQCTKRFISITQLKTHMKIHTGENDCPHCKKTFGSTIGLKNHIMTHTGEKPHTCGECGKKFFQLSNLKNHMNVHLKSKKKPKTQKRSKTKFNTELEIKSEVTD
ncbi:gastrula zinc finger protein XlCGF57.1-like [Phlebotomus papatasi]|uniref:gastrula zinc finger protein XlCGF57.1-like n=1 Tax=Phlebotomus papatasi TaxID=29031 RepID=UPI00248406E9|nr:gastrula zinc finger protein XlCGF57.1-like [Phlebotomus papatasi]